MKRGLPDKAKVLTGLQTPPRITSLFTAKRGRACKVMQYQESLEKLNFWILTISHVHQEIFQYNEVKITGYSLQVHRIISRDFQDYAISMSQIVESAPCMEFINKNLIKY